MLASDHAADMSFAGGCMLRIFGLETKHFFLHVGPGRAAT